LPSAPAPLVPTARALWNAELRAGRRTLATHDALSRAACCEAQADDCDRQARADLARAQRYAAAGAPADARRLALCALGADRDAVVWRARAAEHLADYLTARAALARPATGERRAA
jgi:hypothetical protein